MRTKPDVRQLHRDPTLFFMAVHSRAGRVSIRYYYPRSKQPCFIYTTDASKLCEAEIPEDLASNQMEALK